VQKETPKLNKIKDEAVKNMINEIGTTLESMNKT